MEQLVLGIFQEQLSKIIVGFHREQVNANLLNGKGEIKDVSLNCEFINATVRKVSPFLEFEEIHVSRLGFHVTAWANLRKAPIVVDIGVITAVVKEPLQCLPKTQRRRLQVVTEKKLVQLLLEGVYKPFRGNGSYGFADRIVDNLTVEIETLRISYQPLGKFKTTRIGPWTPPKLVVEVHHLQAVAVDQHGYESTPDQVWSHNRLGMKFFLLHKKVTGVINVKLVGHSYGTTEGTTVEGTTMHILKSMKLETQIAVKRRLRDGAVLAIQSDLTIPMVDINIDATDLPTLVHFVAGLQYCFSKSRSFEDPLRPESSTTPKHSPGDTSFQVVEDAAPDSEEEVEDDEEVDDEEVDDENDAEELLVQGGEEDDAADTIEDRSVATNGDDEGDVNEDNLKLKTAHSQSSMNAPYKEKPILLLPNGIVIYDNVCFTCSIHNVTVRGLYDSDGSGYVQMTAKGCIGEVIWPKTSHENGVYVQSSVSFVSIQERLGRSSQTIVIGGIAQEDHRHLDQPSKLPREVHADENFPLFERRSIRDDPLDLRHTFPSQAFGAKTTIDFLKSDDDGMVPMVLHELGVDEFDIILDAEAWCRALRFLLHADAGGYDARWHTGDWTELLAPHMLKDPSTPLNLDDHVQNAVQIFLDENFMISSDRFNVTARFTNIELKVPAAVKENVRSCDIVAEVNETTLVVSSALPRTFLSGKIGNSISGDALKVKGTIDFPNDPSDIAYSLESAEDPSLRLSGVKLSRNISTFRVQLTVRGFQLKTIPIIPFCNAPEPQLLIEPMGLTAIACFEGEPPEPPSNYIKIAMFISVHVHNFALNIDIDLLAGATSTLIHQADVLKDAVATLSDIFPQMTHPNDDVADVSEPSKKHNKVTKSLKGRRIMVRRHLSQSRETGGLGIVFCLQVTECAITVWRQNVPLVSPIRHADNGYTVPKNHSPQSQIRLLKLVKAQLKEFEVGIEFDFKANGSRRTIVKCCLEEGSVKVCDVAGEIKRCEQLPPDGLQSLNHEGQLMVEVVTFGMEKLPGELNLSYSGADQQFALRLEEQLKDKTRSWSLAADLNCPTTLNACVDECKSAVILMLEALLLPTWSKRSFPVIEGAPFPPMTIGAMFYSLLQPYTTPSSMRKLVWELPGNEADSKDPIVERTLRKLFKLFLPPDMRLVLLRLEIANMLLSIPSCADGEEQRSLGVHLMQADFIVRFYPVPGSTVDEMEDVLACKGVAWSSLIETKEEGYYQSVRSRQSLLSISRNQEGTGGTIEKLVHPFNVGLKYAAAGVHLAMDEDMKIADIRKIESFIGGLKQWQDRSAACKAEIFTFVSAMRQNNRTESIPEVVPPGQPITTDIRPAEVTTSDGVTHMLRLAHSQLGEYESSLRRALEYKDKKLNDLRLKVFQKERERFGALALMSSRTAGWIRMGGVHKTGQRVARKSTLWPYWAVLRKDLLFLYPGPGEARPSDIVVLDGAMLRQLAGGRTRQDVKRGFAIVEREGVVRYFVTASAQEYTHWVREIVNVIRIRGGDWAGYDQMEGDGIHDSALLEGARNELEMDEDSACRDGDEVSTRGARRLGERFAGAKNRLGAALETARQKGRDSARQRGKGKPDVDAFGSSHGSLDKVDAPVERLATAIQSTDPVVSTGGESQDLLNGQNTNELAVEEEDDVLEGPRRRIMLGKALSGMGQATKSRLGSAIQNVRQKGGDAADRREFPETPQKRPLAGIRGRLKGLSSGPNVGKEYGEAGIMSDSIHSGAVGDPTLEESVPWTCDVCTFINENGNGRICDMCGAERVIATESTPNTESVDSAQAITQSETPVETIAEKAQNQQEPARRGRFAALGAAVRGVRQNSLDDEENNQDIRGRPNPKFGFRRRDREAAFEDTPLILRRVHASGQPPTVESANLPLAQLREWETRWVVTVKPSSTSNSNGSIMQKDEAPSGHEPVAVEVNHSKAFVIKSSMVPPSEGSTILKECSWEDILELHTAVSESVVQMLENPWELPMGLTKNGSGSRQHLPEDLMSTGRILGGILALEEKQSSVENLRIYQAEIIESFLNSLVQCPLTDEVSSLLAGLLGIGTDDEGVQRSQLPIYNQEMDPVNTSKSSVTQSITGDDEPTLGHPSAVFSLLSACETQMLRAVSTGTDRETSDTAGTTLSHIGSLIPSAAVKTNIYDPLIPPTFFEQVQASMHEALVSAMAERDEAHAQLIASNILHVHELEQERRKNERLRIEQEIQEEARRLQQPNVGNFFQNLNDDRQRRQLEAKLKNFERILSKNSDEELYAICQQLAGEISAKTSHALEIARLKEERELEKRNELAEKFGLKSELERVKQILMEERAKLELKTVEAAKWKMCYEDATSK